MKIAVLSDIHGNLPALQTVVAHIDAWQPDLVVVDGDVVNRGPLSLDCLRIVQERQCKQGWQVVRGNHEDFVIRCGLPDFPLSGPEFEIWRFAYWAYQRLNGNVTELANWPEQFSCRAPDGSEFRALHASVRNNRDGIYVNTKDKELVQKIAPVPAVFVTAHTHRPLIRRYNGSLVVNVGAVGAPFDRDHRASYGQFTWDRNGWQAEIVRLPYNRCQTERHNQESGFLEGAGPLAQLMLVELRMAHGLIYRWASTYQDAVLAGEILMEDSVREILSDPKLRPYLGSPGWAF